MMSASFPAIILLIAFAASLLLCISFAVFVVNRHDVDVDDNISYQVFKADTSEGSVDSNRLQEALDRLVEFVADYDPRHVISVHTGGRIVASQVCLRLGIPDYRHHYISTYRTPGTSLLNDFRKFNSPLDGKVIVIDDISRGGRTLRTVRSTLLAQKSSGRIDFSALRFATLFLASTTEKAKSGYFEPDFSSFVVSDENFQLPWSGVSAIAEIGFLAQRNISTRDELPENISQAVAIHEATVRSQEVARIFWQLALNNPTNFKDTNSLHDLLDDRRL